MELQKAIVGPWENYCEGYLNPGLSGSGYVCAPVLKLAVKKASLIYSRNIKSEMYSDPEVLRGIDIFDYAEATGPYLGQIDVLTVSSFCGPEGYLWGYNLVPHEQFSKKDELIIEGLKHIKRHDGEKVPIFSAAPLLEASEALFGTRDQLHFPIRPGSMVPCVLRLKIYPGPRKAFCGMGIGIPEDREKQRSAILFMHDVGEVLSGTVKEARQEILRLLATSVVRVGENQNVLYKEILVDARIDSAKEGDDLCALSAVPFITLAKKAFPRSNPGKKKRGRNLSALSLSEWIRTVKKDFLCNLSGKRNI